MSKESSIFDYNSDDIRSGEVDLPADTPSSHEQAPGQSALSGRKLYILIVAVVAVIISAVLIAGAVRRVSEGMVLDLPVGDVSPYSMEDGSYSGSYSASGLTAAVTVDVSEGQIVRISLNSFKGIDTSRVQQVFEAVISAQSLVVDGTDIGSRPTDMILLLAIENALEGDVLY